MNLKEYFDWTLVEQLSDRALAIDVSFEVKKFKDAVPTNLLSLEMKDRVKAIASALYLSIDKPYPEALKLILAMLDESEDFKRLTGFPVWVIAYIVELYGLDHPELSLQAIHKITQHFTGEFAIRPYLQHHRQLTLSVLDDWTSDPSADVRRLVSEGVRPRLPWGKKVDWLIEDPSNIIRLLDKLYDDESEYVRRSVANNLNDIIRHSCRSLIKQSHVGALQLQGYSPTPQIKVKQFDIQPNQINLGQKFEVSLIVESQAKSDQALLIDLELLSPGLNGKSRRRVLKWCRREITAGSTLSIAKKWPIKDTTIRKERVGMHYINLIINGQKLSHASFEVV